MSISLPDASALKELEQAALRMARGAAAVLSRHPVGRVAVDFKGDDGTDPVTEADLKVEEYLRDEITREFPEHGMVAEESKESGGSDNPEFLWAIDPLDGTANFAAGFPFFGISIGLLYRGVPVVGSLFMPQTLVGNGVYHARTGGGAFFEDEPLAVDSTPLPRPSRLSGVPGGFARALSVKRGKGRVLGEVRVLGSIAGEMALVATGAFQSALFTGARIWDVAAGVVLVQEAGGRVVEWHHGSWRPFSEFTPPPKHGDERDADALRRWSVPLLVGGPGIVDHISARVGLRRRSVLTRLGHLARRIGGKRGDRGHA